MSAFDVDMEIAGSKGKFSEIVKRALSNGPQGITVRGEPVAVVISGVRTGVLRLRLRRRFVTRGRLSGR